MTLTRTRTIGLGIVFGAVLALLEACDGGAGPQADAPGTVRVALEIAPGTTIDTVGYRIDGPGAFLTMGSIDVSASATISAQLAPLPPGMNFEIQLVAMSTDGGAMCKGSAQFDVVSRQTTPVLVHLLCKRPTRNGSADLAGPLNICPMIDSLGASPNEVAVGGSLLLSALAHDTDARPSPVSYQWAATSGTLGSATGQSPTLTCTVPGPVTVTLTVSDGDPTPGCADTQTVTVTCTP